MDKKRNVPEIRFAGFTDDWEQRKLGEVLSPYLDPVGTPNNGYIRLGLRSHTKGTFHSIVEAGRELEVAQMHRVAKDKFILNITFAWEHAVAVTDENDEGKLVSHRFPQFSFDDKLIPSFFKYLILDKKFREYLELCSPGGAGRNRVLKIKEMLKYEIKIPKSKKEQTAIGNFFKQLDETIALHQREYEKYKNLKVSYLEKMFPKENEQFPELRFPEFTDAWEQRKLGDLVERVTRKNTNLESNLPLTISAQYGLISQTEFFDKQVASRDISGYYLIENGEFAYNKSYSNGYPWGAIKRLDRHKNGVLSTLYICFKPTKINSQFLVSYYDSQHWYSQMEIIAVEGARNHGLLNIPTEDFFNTVLSIPRSEKEQATIGNFFKQLDETIALHQRGLEKYKQIKQSYLEKMFI